MKRRHYRRMKKAAVVLQCSWRAKLARKELRKLRMVRTSLSVGLYCSQFFLYDMLVCYAP